MFKFNSALSFTRKAPLKDARAHVHDVLCALCVVHHRITLMELYRCTKNFHVSCSKFLEVRGHPMCNCARALHVHIAPQHPKSFIIEKYALNCISVPNFVSLASKFPEGESAYAYA